MITCPYCQHKMPEGALFCDECGLSLYDDPDTTKLDIHSDKIGTQPGWGTVTLGEDQEILLQVGDTPQPVNIQTEAEFVLGRGDDTGPGNAPDLDLTAYGALEKGVSRVHASMRRGEGTLMLVDLDSTNGTFLNGHRLAAHQPHLVRDGDEIRLGKLTINVYFRPE